MQIKQLQIAYAPEHDRLLMRINSADRLEVRCWLTRRMVKLLVPGLNDMMKRFMSSDTPLNEQRKKALLQMSREATLQTLDFKTHFHDDIQDMPLGADPLLITEIELKTAHENNQSDLILKLCTSDTKGFEMRMTEQLQHGFAELLVQTCTQAAWGLDFVSANTNLSASSSLSLN